MIRHAWPADLGDQSEDRMVRDANAFGPATLAIRSSSQHNTQHYLAGFPREGATWEPWAQALTWKPGIKSFWELPTASKFFVPAEPTLLHIPEKRADTTVDNRYIYRY